MQNHCQLPIIKVFNVDLNDPRPLYEPATWDLVRIFDRETNDLKLITYGEYAARERIFNYVCERLQDNADTEKIIDEIDKINDGSLSLNQKGANMLDRIALPFASITYKLPRDNYVKAILQSLHLFGFADLTDLRGVLGVDYMIIANIDRAMISPFSDILITQAETFIESVENKATLSQIRHIAGQGLTYLAIMRLVLSKYRESLYDRELALYLQLEYDMFVEANNIEVKKYNKRSMKRD